MTKRKSAGSQNARKSGDNTGLVPQPHGGALKVGNPGNAGGGRPPDEFKRRMRELASSDEALDYLAECLRGDHGAKAAVSAHKHISERGYGKVPQPIEGTDKPLTVVVYAPKDES